MATLSRPEEAPSGPRRVLWLLPALALLAPALLLSCGDSSTAPPPPPPPDVPRPTSVSISPASATLSALDETVQLTAEVRDQNQRPISGATVTWTNSDDSVVAVNASGLARAVGNGEATITASAGASAAGTATITVLQTAGTISVSPAADTLVAGDTLRLSAEALDANGRAVSGAAFSWSSSDPAVATVDTTGLVTAVSAGGAAIAATSRASGHMELLVIAPAPATINVSPDTVALAACTVRLSAAVLDQLGRVIGDAAVSWSSGRIRRDRGLRRAGCCRGRGYDRRYGHVGGGLRGRRCR
ncbi:Ig-like domain-containing protein [Candidatus Palauibacter sp.]|uniref:Ig-like domain-containing protein n=1 Tax=Candidatus Palauibacter sp. TaxID=3101350 RepID=UPI003AF219B1